jgi:hypothetical protein
MPAGERRGVGLRNTRERLAVLYGANCRFAVLNAHPGLRIEMALPLEIATAPAGAPAARRLATQVSGGVRV